MDKTDSAATLRYLSVLEKLTFQCKLPFEPKHIDISTCGFISLGGTNYCPEVRSALFALSTKFSS